MNDGNGMSGEAAGEGIATPGTKRATPKRARRPVARRKAGRKRQIGFSKPRAKLFLETLGMLCNVAAAVRASGMAETTIYRRRRSDPDFKVQWDEAIREGVVRLEAELLDRALNGVERAIWYGGKQVGTVRDYSDALALAILKRHGPTAGRAPVAATPAAREEQAAALQQWLGEMNQRMGGAG